MSTSASSFVTPVAASPVPSFVNPTSPFLAAQPESLVPQDAVQQAPTGAGFPSQVPAVPFGSASSFPSAGASVPAPGVISSYGKLTLTQADIQALNMVPSGDGSFFSISGVGTFFYKKYFKAIEGARFSKAGQFSSWNFPVQRKAEIEALLSKIKSGEVQPSTNDQLKGERKEQTEKRREKLAKKQAGSQGQQGAQQFAYPGQQFGYPQQPFGYPQQQFGFAAPQPFGFAPPQPFGFAAPSPFGAAPAKVKEPKNFVMGDFQVVSFKVFRPLPRQQVTVSYGGNNYLGVVTDIAKGYGDTTTAVQAQLQTGTVFTIVLSVELGENNNLRGKWQVKGFAQEHTVFFKGQ